MNSSLFKNLEFLSKRFPTLGEKICSVNPTTIQAAQTEDGGFCYVKTMNDGSYQPLSSTSPVQSAKNAILPMEDRIQNGLAPVVVIGLNPGFVLESVYNHFKEYCYEKYLPRRIYVIVDSIECLYGWLKRDDRSEILENHSIEFYWHQEVSKIVNLCNQDETRSHLFVPVSSLPEHKVMNYIQPLADLFIKREEELKTLQIENNEYYEKQSDEKLDKILQGKSDRKPRMLIPSHASSTVVQYSVRDTKALFEKEGWEVEIIHMKTDLSQWRVAKRINDFKPDVYMLVNHLRTEEVKFYPPDMMFITWVQDTVTYINNTEIAKTWNKHVESKIKRRDLIIGYVGQIREYGYLKNSLVQCQMIINEDIFKPYNLTPNELKKYSCDVCFASNRSKDTSLIVLETLIPLLSKYGCTKDLLMKIHDKLWEGYRSGETYICYEDMLIKISELEEVSQILQSLDNKNDLDFFTQSIFWKLNDVIYRHIVLEWIDQIGNVNLHLYGRGWEQHPKFKKYAKGVLRHGEELSKAYQAAKWSLHLNCLERDHQRLNEIKFCKGSPLNRQNGASSNFDFSTFEELKELIALSLIEREQKLDYTKAQVKSLQNKDDLRIDILSNSLNQSNYLNASIFLKIIDHLHTLTGHKESIEDLITNNTESVKALIQQGKYESGHIVRIMYASVLTGNHSQMDWGAMLSILKIGFPCPHSTWQTHRFFILACINTKKCEIALSQLEKSIITFPDYAHLLLRCTIFELLYKNEVLKARSLIYGPLENYWESEDPNILFYNSFFFAFVNDVPNSLNCFNKLQEKDPLFTQKQELQSSTNLLLALIGQRYKRLDIYNQGIASNDQNGNQLGYYASWLEDQLSHSNIQDWIEER